MRIAAVEENGLLDQPQSHRLRDKVDVFLRACGVYRDFSKRKRAVECIGTLNSRAKTKTAISLKNDL